MVRAVLLDVDDTLYWEREFIVGGFRQVGVHLESRGFETECRLDDYLLSVWDTEGRDRVLDKASERLGFPQEWVPQLVAVFRDHEPDIRPFPEVRSVLARLRADFRLALVTDGHAEVQRRKIRRLGLDEMVDGIVVADDFGRDCWKPAPYPFLAACAQLEVSVGEAIMVGDNPERDIRGARAIGMRSIRVRRPEGFFYTTDAAPGDTPDYEIESLNELVGILEALGHVSRP